MKVVLDEMLIRKYQLIYYLYYHQGTALSIVTLSELFQVSKKTILTDLMEIGKKNYISTNISVITIKIAKGHVDFKFSKGTSILAIRQSFMEQSVTFKLLKAFYQEHSFKIVDFSLTNYYSLSVVYKKIKQLKLKLKPYELEIQSQQGRYFLIGNEEKKRCFYSELYYYVYGDRNSFLDYEKKIAESFLKRITISSLETTFFQKKETLKLSILFAVSLQRMKKFPLIKGTDNCLNPNQFMEHKGRLFLESTYPQYSKTQIILEHHWIIHFINDKKHPFVAAKEKKIFEGLKKVSTIFKFQLESQEGKEYTQLMLMYYKEKRNQKSSAIVSKLLRQDKLISGISSDISLQLLRQEAYREVLEKSLYPINLEECVTILKISGIGIKKLKLSFISECPRELKMFLYRKILTVEMERFYEWSDDVTNSDIVVSDDCYSFIDDKKMILLSSCPSGKEIKRVRKELIMYINKVLLIRLQNSECN